MMAREYERSESEFQSGITEHHDRLRKGILLTTSHWVANNFCSVADSIAGNMQVLQRKVYKKIDITNTLQIGLPTICSIYQQ